MVICKVLYSLAPSLTSEEPSEVTTITRRAASRLIAAYIPRVRDQTSPFGKGQHKTSIERYSNGDCQIYNERIYIY